MALILLLVGCDAAGTGDTAILNADSVEPPIVEYRFEYDPSDQVDGQDLVRVKSNGTDNLGEVLRLNGFRRSDVVSARIDSVKFVQVSAKRKAGPPTPKFVFDNLLSADVFLGPSTDGPKIASGDFDPNDDSDVVPLQVERADVTEIVKEGATSASLQLGTSGDITRTDRVDVTVYYRIEVKGV
ncbi:MAG: hypothetical protein ABEL97_12300 [Salinibacter sp.]